MRRPWNIALALLIGGSPVFAGREMRYPKPDSPHYLYLPQEVDSAKTYWLVVGVHGAGGRNKGANGMAGWVDKRDNVIVLGPKFGNTYQNAYPEDQAILTNLFKTLQKEYKLHPKMFIYGFSGGSQFAHRFVMKQPDIVCGVSSHSGGSWATGQYGKLNEKAKHIPFAISCGEKDTGKAWGEAPYNRLEWYKRFAASMQKAGFFFKGATWPNVGHGACNGVRAITEECFQLATRGMLPGSELATKLSELTQLAQAGQFDKAQAIKYQLSTSSAKLPQDSGWQDSKEAQAIRKDLVKNALAEVDTSPAARRQFGLYTRCLGLLKSDDQPDDRALLAFVDQCPPTYWRGKPESELVFKACNAAAANKVSTIREQKQLNMETYQSLIKRWDGLAVRDELLKEYDDKAQEQLDKVLTMKKGSFKQRALKDFIRRWKVGDCVEKAKAALEQ